MTTHELAEKILQMPNIPIATHVHDSNSPHSTIWQKVGLMKYANYGKFIILSTMGEKK